MNETWCDIHAHARPIHFTETTVACLSHQEILDHKTNYHHFSVGIHPWWLENLKPQELTELKNHVETLIKNPHAVAVGEAGLDRLYKNTWDQQLELFKWQWDLAEANHKPMVIHKVRSGSDLLGLMKARRPKTPWIFHDYNGSLDEVEHLLALHSECYFSFGESLLHRNGVQEIVETLETQYLLIETDEESQLQLPHYYEKMAQLKSLTLFALEQQITQNFSKIFKKS